MKIKYFQYSLMISLFCLSACDYGRMWETPAVRPHEEAILVMPEGTVPFDGGENIRVITPADALQSPIEMQDPVEIEQGKTSYFIFCAQCHGSHYDGNGTVGQSFSPLPTNLKTVKVQSLSEGAMFKEISYGVPGGRQPPLASTIEACDRWRIVAHVKSLGPRN